MTFSKTAPPPEDIDKVISLAISTRSQIDDNFDEAREILASQGATLEAALEQLKQAKAHSQSAKTSSCQS